MLVKTLIKILVKMFFLTVTFSSYTPHPRSRSQNPGLGSTSRVGSTSRSENPRIFSGFFRRSFCTYRELRKPKSDHVHPGFSYFFPFLTPQKSHENPSFPLPLQNPFPWDHAQMIERKILFRIALTRALYDQIRP